MSPAVYPYTVTNSYKGGLFMRTYSRNVRRAWDGEDYRPPKRLRLSDAWNAPQPSVATGSSENAIQSLDLEDNLERAIRETSVAAMSSSPSRKNSIIFSAESQDDDLGSNTITPPSSPPPGLQLTPPNVKARKPTFSFIEKSKKEKKDLKAAKRKRDGQPAGPSSLGTTRLDSEPLSEIFNSSTRAPSSQPPFQDASTNDVEVAPVTRPTVKPVPPKPKFIQTILDLGQPLAPTTCPQCQMSYTPSLPEDAQLHNMYHNRDSSGIELGKSFLKSAMRWCYQVSHIPGSVVVVDRKMAQPSRKVVLRVLEIINKELGSVDIKEDDLWSQRVPDGEDEESGGRKCDRYKAFLHVVDEKCVGICLAERITKAHRVLPNETSKGETVPLNGHYRPVEPASPAATEANEEESNRSLPKALEIPTPIASPTSASPPSCISISESTYPAVVGVSRIWTSKAFRHKGIAHNLLECVMNQFIYGMEIRPEQMAFSQPTESGAGLARAWFGETSGWSVYRED